jgi:hypothetical protein
VLSLHHQTKEKKMRKQIQALALEDKFRENNQPLEGYRDITFKAKGNKEIQVIGNVYDIKK